MGSRESVSSVGVRPSCVFLLCVSAWTRWAEGMLHTSPSAISRACTLADPKPRTYVPLPSHSHGSLFIDSVSCLPTCMLYHIPLRELLRRFEGYGTVMISVAGAESHVALHDLVSHCFISTKGEDIRIV